MAVTRSEILGLLAEIILKAENDPAMQAKISGIRFPGNASSAPRDVHEALDKIISEKTGGQRDAPQWAHDALDAVWDFFAWLL